MTDDATAVKLDVRRQWFWFGSALFLLVPLDLFTTLLAVARYGITAEANPVMRWLLRRGLVLTTVANLLVAGVAIALFHLAIGCGDRLPPSECRTFAVGVDAWIAALIVVGVVVVSNNLLLIL